MPVYESEYGEFRYSVSESFEEQIDGVLNNTFDKNNHIYMGNTPNSLQSILHLQNRPMLITPTHVYTMTVSEAQAKADGRYVKGRNYHDLGKDILLGLPKALEKPLFLIKSSAKQSDLRIIAVTSLTDKNGVNIVAAIEPDGKGKLYNMTLDSNVVLSGYGKSNILNYVLNAKKEGRILYASEKNNRLGKNRPGVQFPDHAFTADYTNSLSQYRETVNKYYAQNDKEYLSNSNKYQNYVLSDDQRASISDAGMRLTDNAELSSLMRDNADYKAEIERLKGEFVKSKRMGGKGKNALMQADINRIARSIIGEYSSEISFYDLKDMLTGFYEFLANADVESSGDYAFIVKTANDIAKSVIAQSFTDITPEEFADYKKAQRSYRLIPNLQDVSELKDMFGTFGAAYRQYGKKLNMRAKGTENAFYIDDVWEDLCETVPLLDRNADSTQEMWRNLIEVRDSLDEKTGFNPYLEDGELSAGQAAALLGADILERFNEVSPDTTFADRAQQRVDLREQKISELKTEKREALSKLREQRDTKISELKTKKQEALSKLREQRDARILELKESFRQQNEKRRKRNAQTIDRRKIRRLIKRFKNIYNHGSKDRNVKAEMRKTVEKVLESADFLFADEKTGYDILAEITPSSVENEEQRAALKELQRLYDGYLTAQSKLEKAKQSQESGERSEELLNRISEYEKLVEKQRAKLYSLSRSDALSGILAEKRAAANRQTVGKALQGLYDAYCELKNSGLGYIRNAYNDVVAEKLKSIAEELSDKSIRSMNEAELSQLYDAYKMVYHTMTTQNKLFKSGKKQTVEQAALTAMEEMKEATRKSKLPDFRHPLSQKALSGKRSFEWSMMTPYTAFQKTGSKEFTQMYFDFIRGQDTYARDIAEAKETLSRMREKYGYDDWNLDKAKTFNLESGQKFTVTLSELMSAYAISRREQGRKHIENGGFVFGDNKKGFFAEVKTDEKDGEKKKRVVRTAKEAYRLTENDMNRMFGISEEGGLTDKQRRFVEELQDYLTKIGEKGNEVSRQLYGIDIFKEKVYFPLESDRDFLNMSSEQGQETLLKNSGMTKETVKNAKNPIVLRGFEDVWSGHINQMALYHGFVLPIENLNRILSFTPYLEEDTSRSVKTTLKNIFGEESVKYFEDFSRDLNGGTVRKAALYELPIRLIARFKKTAVAVNLSVELQQAMAIVRAMAEIDGKYFANTPAAKENKSVSRFKEIQKYAPIAIIKEMGGFDTGSGRAATDFILAREYEGKDKIKGLLTDRYYRDELFMWGAAKADEFGWSRIWDAVKREIADTTDLEFNSKEFLEKCGERFTEVIVKTQVYDSTLSRSAMMRSDSEIMKMATAFMGEPTTSVNMLYRASIDIRRGKAGAVKRFARVTAAVYASIILAAVFKSLVGAGRDDDEDESFWDKYLQALARNLAGDLNPLTMLPFVKDIVEIIDGNDVTRQDLEVVTSFFDACEALSNEDMSLYRKLESFVGGLCNFAGLPVKNIMRDIRGIYNTVNSLGRPSTTTGQEVVSEFVSNIPIAGKASAAKAKQASKITAKYEKAYKAKDLTTMKKLISDEIEAEREKLLDKGADPYELTGTKGKRKNKVNSDARGKVRAKFTEEFKPRYVEAFDNKDVNTVAEIKSILSQTGLYDDLNGTLESWRKEAKEKKEQEKRAEERKKSK